MVGRSSGKIGAPDQTKLPELRERLGQIIFRDQPQARERRWQAAISFWLTSSARTRSLALTRPDSSK
jgi:hypothetical protein